MAEEHATMKPEDLQQRPTVMLTLDEFGNVEFGVNRNDMTPHLVVYMLEAARATLLTQTIVQAAQAREAAKPKIHTPRLAVNASQFR